MDTVRVGQGRNERRGIWEEWDQWREDVGMGR